MAKKKVVSYEDKKFDRENDIYNSLVQCIQDLKYGDVGSNHRWNLPVEAVHGLTHRLVGEGNLELTWHHYELTSVNELAYSKESGKDFLKEIVKELKKLFKKKTGKALELKEVTSRESYEKVSGFRADRSWSPDSAVGRFLVRNSCVYSFEPELLK